MKYTIRLLITIPLVSCNPVTHKEPSSNTSSALNTTHKNPTPPLSDSCKYYLILSQSLDSMLIKATQYDTSLAIKSNNTFVKCALWCEHDSISPLYLIKAAQISHSLGKPTMSEKYLQKIITNYPHSKFIPPAKLLLGQFYADTKILNKPEKARELFNSIIKDYPRTVWAENATAALQWIGKSDEEILKEIKRKK